MSGSLPAPRRGGCGATNLHTPKYKKDDKTTDVAARSAVRPFPADYSCLTETPSYILGGMTKEYPLSSQSRLSIMRIRQSATSAPI